VIPKLHAKGGSFHGAALYLLHDKEAASSDRVAWTETRNLATDNPDAAWRVMAATAMDQARLKEEAGIKSTGRRSKQSVLHLTLSWHPDEAEGLSQEEMMRAAHGAIRALGAGDHQALCVSHDDEPQPHVHILLNRVSPIDGRMLSSSKEKLALSAWAESYERERGEILCEERALNNAARARGQFVRGAKEKPRHIYELEASNDNQPGADKLREAQRKKDMALRKKSTAQAARRKKEWADLIDGHREKKAEIYATAKKRATIARDRVAERFKDDWRQLYHEQNAERRAFALQEQGAMGRAKNALRQVDWRGLLRSGRRGQAIRQAFGLLSSSGVRAEALRCSQQRENLALEKREGAAGKKAVSEAHRVRDRQLENHGGLFSQARSDLILKHGLEGAALKAAWAARGKQRREAWGAFRGKVQAPSARERNVKATAEAFMDRMRQARKEQDRDRGKGDTGRER